MALQRKRGRRLPLSHPLLELSEEGEAHLTKCPSVGKLEKLIGMQAVKHHLFSLAGEVCAR